ncbi:MAG: type II secretion system protein GspC [Gammaproteobacteria bacterium]|nr:MAG: type II secretion system protein GspC [Gammaproteobacteria bacterium]
MNSPAKLITRSIDIQKLHQTLPGILTLVLVIACSFSLAQLTWLLIPAVETSQAPPVTSQSHNPALQSQSALQQKIQQISQAHLFGEFQSQPTETVKADAPETRLNLVLKGLLAATPMTHASAIISMGANGEENIYAVGDRISSATIREIHDDRVILENNGRYETLRLPKDFDDSDIIQSVDDSAAVTGSSTPSTPGEVLSDIRQKILRNPTSFGEFAIPIPYNENGKLRGYRLQPQGDRALFDEVGLDPNDVIIAINGLSLDNPNNGLQALRKLQNAKSVDITVLRNGAEIPLHFEMP